MKVRRRAVAYTQGHGTSVLTEAQYRVLLSFRRYGGEPLPPQLSGVPASLEDILPTVLQALDLPDDAADGKSLLTILEGSSAGAGPLHDRIRFTETDFNVPRMLAGEINVKWLAQQSIEYYRINPDSGWVEFKTERLPEMLEFKERAAIRGEWLMAALPGPQGRSTYVLVNRGTRKAELVTTSLLQVDTNAAALLAALRARYPELPTS